MHADTAIPVLMFLLIAARVAAPRVMSQRWPRAWAWCERQDRTAFGIPTTADRTRPDFKVIRDSWRPKCSQ
jgi:hypothetical protein